MKVRKVSKQTEVIVSILYALFVVVVIFWFGFLFLKLASLEPYCIGIAFGLILYPILKFFAKLLRKEKKE